MKTLDLEFGSLRQINNIIKYVERPDPPAQDQISGFDLL